MPLSPDEIRNVYNNEDEATATELMAGDREDVKNFNENVVSPSKTFNALSQNVLYAPFTNGTHKYFDVLENAYVPAERSISKDFSRSMIKDELNERRNKLITEANKESDPALKESMRLEAADITKRLSYLSSLPETENLDAFASILRGIKRSAPAFAAGTAASLATGGSALVGVGVTAFGNFLANKELNYNEAYAGALDSGANLSAEELDERATKSMYVMSLLDGLDAATGLGGGALKIAREWGKSAISREFLSELKKKLAKETILKAAGSVAKSAAKEAAIEGATEVVQDKSRERIMRGEGAISSVGYAVGDFVGAIGRTIAGTATPEDKEAMKTFRSVFFASLVFSGGMNSVHKFAPRIYSAVKQNQVEKSDRVYFDNMKKIGLVQPAVDIVDDVMDTNNKRPEYRYADAKKLQTVLEEDLQREDLSDAQRTREEDLLRRSIEAQKTTGQVELTAKEHANTFLDPLNETLFQKTNKQTFFVDPESIYEDYSLEQLTLQAVEEIDKEALSEGSAFMDVYNVLKESGQAADSELIANSLQHHALLTTAATAQEKTYSDLKAEYGLKLNAEAKEAVNDKDVVKGVVSGEVSRQGNEIMLTLTKDANPTTFSHESFHLFELIMGDAFKGGKLTPYWAKQMQKLYKAAGIDDLNAFYKGELGGNVRIERAMKSEAARKQREAKLAAKALARDEEKSVRDFVKFQGEALKGREKEIRDSLKEINTKVENAVVKSVLKAAKRFSEKGYKEYKKAPKTRLQYIKDYLSANGYRGIADNRESADKTIDAFGGSNTELFIPEELSEYSKLGAQKKGAKPVHYERVIEDLVQAGELQEGATLNDLTEWMRNSDTPLIGGEGERTKSSLVGEAYERMTRDADVKANEKSVREFVRSKIKEANEGLGYFANEAIDKLIAKETEEVKRVYNELRANGLSSVVAYEDAIMEARGFMPNPDAKLKYYQGKPAETLYGDVQERLAEAWTEYLQTGESPKKAYETMFAKFKELFAPIYKNFVRQGALNKSIREVYDRIFLSYEEAKEVARERRIGLINRPAGVDDETWGKYTAAKKMAIARSSDGIVKAIRELSQMKNDAEYQAELANVRERLEAELENDKQFKMQDYLLTKDAPKIKTSEVSGLDVGWYNKKMTAKDGMTLDEAVDFLNMQFDGSIDASDLLGILTGPTREQYIDMQADRAMNAWMRGRYPELFARISAESTMNNMSAIDAVLYEYMFLSNDTGMKINKEAYGDIKVMFERAVEKTLEETPVKRMSSEKYKKMLLGNALKQRAAGESKAKLAELKYQQAILMRLAELSADVEKDVNSLVKMSQKYKKSLDDSKQRSAIDADSRELIRSIFNDAGVSKMSLRQGEVSTIDKLANWVSEYGNKQYRNENDIDIYSELVPLLQKVEGIGYKNLNASELKSLKEGLMFIKNVSEESRLEKMRDVVAERDADATEFAAQLAERGFKQDVSELTKHKLKMVSVPILLKSVLPENLHQKYLRPFFNGIIASNNAKKADFERIAEIFGDEVNRLNDKFVYNGIVMTRENLLVMMLNTGTVHNVRTLATTMLHNADRWGLQVKNKNRFTEDEIQSAINLARDICASAPDNFADIVSDIWALIDSKKEQMRAAYKHVTNNLMKFEQIEQLDGVNPKLKGGYYPIHRMYLTKTQDDLFSQNFRDTTAMSTVSSLKDRGDATATDMSLTLDGLNQWVETTERYSNVAVPYYELASFFNQQKVAEALGKDYSKVISDWMQNADRPLKTLSAIKTLNVLTDVKVLGFSPIKMMRQYSGILFAAGDVGYRNVLQSFGEYMTDANRLMHPIEEAQKLSPYMRDRYSNYAKTVLGGEAVSRESQKGVVWSTIDKALDKVSPVALCLLTMADAQASTIVWEAQYDKSIRAGKTHAEAVFDADSVVMRTQGDASSYSRPEIMRGELRFFMKYMTYFTSVYSSLFSSRMYGNNAAERMKFAITLANATIICTLYESVINTIPQLWSDDDDDDETFYRKWLNEIGSTAGNVMLPLFGLGQSAGRVLTGQRVYAPSFVPLTPVYNFYQKATRLINKDDAELADYVDLIMTASPIPKDISRWVTEELR